MELVDIDDSILTTECKTFEFRNSPFEVNDFAQKLVKFMYDKNAISVTANQVGVPYRIFAMRGSPQNFVCINPKIVMPSTEQILLEETNIMYPGLIVKVKRPQHCRVRWTMPNGETRTDTFTGLSARTFQQNVDTLDGIIYYNLANKYHRDLAFKKWKK